jgi:hypothetical protein
LPMRSRRGSTIPTSPDLGRRSLYGASLHAE